jgi:hypothetical protein
LQLALSEVQFRSWASLTRASGILFSILEANYSKSPELQEMKSFRADILREMLSERELIRRSPNEVEARAIALGSLETKSIYKGQLIRLIESIGHLGD